MAIFFKNCIENDFFKENCDLRVFFGSRIKPKLQKPPGSKPLGEKDERAKSLQDKKVPGDRPPSKNPTRKKACCQKNILL